MASNLTKLESAIKCIIICIYIHDISELQPDCAIICIVALLKLSPWFANELAAKPDPVLNKKVLTLSAHVYQQELLPPNINHLILPIQKEI